jgi:hypothetical protein
MAVHISCPDNTGWCFVSTFTPGNPQPPTGWFTFSNEILQVKLDGSQVLRLAHHRSRPNPLNTYDYQPRVSTSRDGSRVVFTSNYNLHALLGYGALYADIYLMVLVPERKMVRAQTTSQ